MKRLWIIPAALAAAAALFTEELYRFMFVRGGSPILDPILDKKGHEPPYYFMRDTAAEALRQRHCERLTIRSARGEKLCGFYYPGGGEGKRIAFLLHGYRSDHAEASGLYYEYYASRGFDLFCCDHTAHGESEGRTIGFDVFESEDCLLWLDKLQERFGKGIQVVLHGFSMGGATVMRMSSRCPGCVKCIVEDSGFQSAETQLRPKLGVFYPVLYAMHRLIARCDLRDSDVMPSLAAASLPILFVHGKQDRSVPYENGPRLYEAYRGAKDCFFPDEARHVESMYRAPEQYAEKLDALIRQTIEF